MASIMNSSKTKVNSRTIVIKSELPAMLEGTSQLCFTGIGTSARKEVRGYAIDEQNTSRWVLRLCLLSSWPFGSLPQLGPILSELVLRRVVFEENSFCKVRKVSFAC